MMPNAENQSALRQTTTMLLGRLRQHERGARQGCTCRSDQASCVACDCGLAADEIERLRSALVTAEKEARRFASYYPESSDGRNTFLMLADRIREIASD